jgi:hypothetical protein
VRILTAAYRAGGYAGVFANNPYALYLAAEWGAEAFLGAGLNVLNESAARLYRAESGSGRNVLLSCEIREPDYRLFADWESVNYFLYVYGRLPIMQLNAVPSIARLFGRGKKGGGTPRVQLRDGRGNTFGVDACRADGGYFRLRNSVPINLLYAKNKIKPHFFFDFCGERAEEARRILTAYRTAGNGGGTELGAHTTGRYFK